MSALNQAQIDQARAAARQAIVRAGTDPEFGRQLRTNPVGTLTAAGVPADAIREPDGTADEVSGYVLFQAEGGEEEEIQSLVGRHLTIPII